MVLFHIERLSFSLPPLSDSIHFCVFICVFTCIHVDTYVCVHMDVCVHACMQVCVHIHMWKPEKDAQMVFSFYHMALGSEIYKSA